ncbi:MAG: DUF1684 domain-containing protein [Ktedonobacteraceae bacterium]|nr:DUF1684 domain-containing protein [Ktedonobacteraceae bacterium]
MSDYIDLYDYRSQVAGLYRERNRAMLNGDDPATILRRFRAGRDDLFRGHPQSALDEEQRRTFTGLRYFPYHPALCVSAELDTSGEVTRQQVTMNASEQMMMSTVGRLHFVVEGQALSLALYWLEIYGGGLFLPFRDLTCPQQSYGGGRYLFDTIKGSDFLADPDTSDGSRIMLDFNYAYNPSCAYNSRWVCPLAPVENRLHVSIRAGEMKHHD